MGKIQTLNYNTSIKIAAGEVIDRPASVVRELIDNAIDANAKHITVDTWHGGKTLMEVRDDGIGMDAEDLGLCIKNHSTSKIQNFSDIENLQTLGFRGEALSSIAEVSQLTLSSRTRESNFGDELKINYGKSEEMHEKAQNPGTTVRVENLFGNLPARKKFLGSDSTEIRHITRELIKKSLAYPEIGFELLSNGKLKHASPPRKTRLERIADFYPDPLPYFMTLEYQQENLSFFALLSKPAFIRPNRMYQYFFVNQRAVEWKPFSFAVNQAYNNLIPRGQFPAIFFYLEIDPHEIDFNVHPMKREVRFRNAQALSKLIRREISQALFAEDGFSQATDPSPFTPYESRVVQSIRGYLKEQEKISTDKIPTLRSEDIQWGLPDDHPVQDNIPLINPPEEKQGQLFKKNQHSYSIFDELKNYRFVGSLFSTYLILELETKAAIIDQHAAHERIRYERLKANYRNSLLDKQELLLPVQIKVPTEIVELLKEHLETLSLMGFEIESFGDQSFLIRSTPVYIDHQDAEQVVLGYVETLLEDPTANPHTADFIDHAIKQMACKGAIRSGDNIAKEEVMALIEDLSKTPNPYSCPHGRPILFYADQNDFAKLFKRTGF